ncbi:hypothetical protein Amsp01_043330 [Amycolatopsis sp. NBRC 101858]|uniref:hypothetical protein n=1 Tax=Amycolatopsis sp. NBRC 101858 TaxID=3032200 RepID=UPI0024A5ACDA|nr:hypothetical protein [Amycolatopsis sp. NBRC 101858]GLY38309.1 hypothetical protein Amsp01_043330 [Amycolatopsis sp. NBRC 101858]
MTPEPDAARIAAAVLAVPDVAGLHGGRFGEIATLDPPRRIKGVRVRDEDVTIAVTAHFPVVAADLAAAVRAAAGVTGRAVHVILADLAEHPTVEQQAKEKVS